MKKADLKVGLYAHAHTRPVVEADLQVGLITWPATPSRR